MCAACSREPQAPVAEWAIAEVESPAGAGSAETHFAELPDEGLVMSWLEPDADKQSLRFATFTHGAWSLPRTIASGDDWFVNWADLPSVVPIDGEHWIAHWLELQPEQAYTYDIVFAISGDRGLSWSTPRKLNADQTTAEHGFVTFFPWADSIGAIWLDGRIVGAMSIDELLATQEAVGMSLRYARMSASGEVFDRGLIDELVCDCCQTGAVATVDGPLIVYRDRSQEEQRDIAVRHYDGRAWSEPMLLGPDGWHIDGCPVNGPSVDQSGSNIAVAWFTASENEARVRFARSVDAGRSFSPAITLDESGAFGHTDIVMTSEEEAIVSWWRRAPTGGMDLMARKIVGDNVAEESRTIAHTESSAPIDVPQMGRAGDLLVFAWTEFGDEPGIRTVTAPVW